MENRSCCNRKLRVVQWSGFHGHNAHHKGATSAYAARIAKGGLHRPAPAEGQPPQQPRPAASLSCRPQLAGVKSAPTFFLHVRGGSFSMNAVLLIPIQCMCERAWCVLPCSRPMRSLLQGPDEGSLAAATHDDELAEGSQRRRREVFPGHGRPRRNRRGC